MNDRILLIDGTNNFLRNYVVVPAMTSNGDPIGGTFGFIRSLLFFVEKMSPSKVFICWDGEQGSFNRRKIFKEYKEGRKPPTLNRTYEITEEEAKDNKIFQLTKLKLMLDVLPVMSLEYEFTEADDIISLIAFLKKDSEKIIISSDKDFFQLCDDKTVCFNPVKREYKTNVKILSEYNVSCNNFSILKAIVGDKSDNIDGVSRIGLKTVPKLFPFLSENKQYFVSDIFQYSRDHLSENKKYGEILDNSETIMRNFKLVQLGDSILPNNRIQDIKTRTEEYKVSYEPVAFRMAAMEDLLNFDVDRFIQVFNGLFLRNK